MKSLKYILLSFLIASSTLSVAQVYPVQATVQLTPPYSLYLTDYVESGTERLVLNIFLADIARPQLDVRFRLKIIGQGITIETKPEYRPAPMSIHGGVSMRLVSTDLSDYFNANNLNFQGISRREYEQRGMLPEGVYQFCLEVLEYNRGIKVSNTACGTAWMILNDPPIINLPRQNEKLKAQSPQNIVLQWTPRHTGSPNSAFTTEYDVTLVEVWPSTRNPNDAILTSPPIFETTTGSTTVIYGPAETPLEPGRRYAFRVRARSIAGVSELDLFKNNGYSEVFTFVYGDACDLPTGIAASSIGTSRFSLGWEGAFNHTGYRVRYREAGTTNWYENTVAVNAADIYSLKPSTTYEYQVAATCGFYDGSYSATSRITTSPLPEAEYACGAPLGNFTLDPSQLTGSLKTGDIIQAGDFDVKLTKVSGSNGIFTGEGVIEVPYLNKAKVKVEFTSIAVNKELRMVNGSMNVTGAAVDVIPQGVMDLMDDLTETLNTIDSALVTAEENLPKQFDPDSFVADTLIDVTNGISSVYKDTDGSVVVVDNKGNEQRIPAGTSAAVKDSDGNGYLVDSKGNIHKTTADVAAKAGSREFNFALKFAANTAMRYGFDERKHDAIAKDYEQLKQGYSVSWKSVASGGTTDVVAAIVYGTGIDKSKITFEQSGIVLQPQPFTGNQTTLSVRGGSDGIEEGLPALYSPTDTGKVQVLGKLNVVSYNKLSNSVVIVPVNKTTLPSGLTPKIIEDSLNAIYSQAIADWKVSVASPIEVDLTGTFDTGETGLLSNYTDDMKKVIKAFGSLQDETYYIFLVENPSAADVLGYMPRGKQAGFVFVDRHGSNKDALVRTIAHELGHGAYSLHHTFKEPNFSLTQGATDNLMDYPSGKRLYKYQWDKMRYPDIVVGLFEDDEEGKNVVITDMSALDEFKNKPDGTYTFITPAGNYITLPKGISGVKFSTLDRLFVMKEDNQADLDKPVDRLLPLGSLSGFAMDGVWYNTRVSGGNFIGYAELGTDNFYPKEGADIPNPTNTTSGIVVFVGTEDNNFVNYISRFKSGAQKVELSNAKGTGAVLTEFSVVDLTPGLSKALKDFLTETKSAETLKIDKNVQLYLTNKDEKIGMITGEKTVSEFLLTLLSESSSITEYISYFQLVSIKENELTAFSDCFKSEATLDLQTTRMLANEAMRKALYGGSGRLTEASQMLSNIKSKTLDELVNYAKTDIELISKIESALSLDKPEKDIYDLLTKHYTICTFSGFEIAYRLKLLNKLLGNNDLWYYNDHNIILDIISTTPSDDQLALLKDGFMANNYHWLLRLWDGATGWFNGVEYESMRDIFDKINPWIAENFSKLNIKPTKKAVIDPQFGFIAINYFPGELDYVIGMDNEESYPITRDYEFRTGPYSVTSKISFEDSDGRIHLSQNYLLEDTSPIIYAEGRRPDRTSFVEYEEDFNPFEPINFIVAANFHENGFNAGDRFTVPAYMVMVYDKDLGRTSSNRTARKVVDFVAVAAALLAAPETGGGSLAYLGAITTQAAGVMAAGDILLERNNLTVEQYNQNKEFYEAWDNVRTKVDYVNMLVGGVQITKWGWSKVGSYKQLSNSISSMKNTLGNIPSTLPRLKAGWDKLLRIKPGVTPATVTQIGISESKLFGSSSKYFVNDLDDLMQSGKIAGYDDEFVMTLNSIGKRPGMSTYDDLIQFMDEPLQTPRLPEGTQNVGLLTQGSAVIAVDELVAEQVLKIEGQPVIAYSAPKGATVVTNPALFKNAVTVTKYRIVTSTSPAGVADVLVASSPSMAPQLIFATAKAAEKVLEKQKDKQRCKTCQRFVEEICLKFETLQSRATPLNAVGVTKLCNKLTTTNVDVVLDYLLAMNVANLNTFLGDLKDAGDPAQALSNNVEKVTPAIIRAWELVLEAKGSLRYKVDFSLLKQISSMKSTTNQGMYNTLGGDNVLVDVMKKNVSAPCNTCSNNKVYLRKMDEYLTDVVYFVRTFGKNTNGNRSSYVFTSGIISNSPRQVTGAVYMLKVLNANHNIVPTLFESKLTGTTNNCEADARVNNKILEFKSWSPGKNDTDIGTQEDGEYTSLGSSQFLSLANNSFSQTPNSYTQFLCYLSNISNMSDLEYVFDRAQLQEKGQSDPDAYVKNIFRELLRIPNEQTQIFNIIWNNQQLRGSLFGVAVNPGNLQSKQNALNDFQDWIDSMDPKLFNFIKTR